MYNNTKQLGWSQYEYVNIPPGGHGLATIFETYQQIEAVWKEVVGFLSEPKRPVWPF